MHLYRTLLSQSTNSSNSSKITVFMLVLFAIINYTSTHNIDYNSLQNRRKRQDPNDHWANDPAKQAYVTANHEPTYNEKCDYRMYVDFFKEVAHERDSASPYNKAVGKKYTDHPQVRGRHIILEHLLNSKLKILTSIKATASHPKIMDPKYLCIRTDAGKNIDVNQFDCLPNKIDVHQVEGLCGCGSRWSRIDLNDPNTYLGLNTSTHSYEYKAFVGLDKFLVLEEMGDYKFDCVADRFGHCTLDKYRDIEGWKITNCRKGYKCRNVSILSPILKSAIQNTRTEEWYGICISEDTADELYGPFSGAIYKKGDVILIATCMIITVFFQHLTSLRLHHALLYNTKNEYQSKPDNTKQNFAS